MDWRTGAGFLAIILCTMCANLLLKVGAMVPSSHRAVLGLLSYQSVMGLFLFGCGGLIYSVVLRFVPLNLAQVFTSLQPIGVILLANVVLDEPISGLRWLGIACTMMGVAIVSATAHL